MTNTDRVVPIPKFRGSLTAHELENACAALRTDALQGFLSLWDLLLAKAGQPPTSEAADLPIRPDEYSIPFSQAKALVAAIEPSDAELHFAWVLAWMNWGPAWHTD
jgi:hypothetical protein